jgi:NAD(P)-dependent dehydrogenase (short-subunit alcohol dehydrogenase family)
MNPATPSGSAALTLALAEKVALVTGAASGIGSAVGRRLAAAGAHVVLSDVNQAGLGLVSRAIQEAGGRSSAVGLEVGSEADWEAACAGILSVHGRLDICVNAAGIALAGPLTDLSLADWQRVMRTNLDGVFLGTRHALRAMKAKGGCIVNIGSAAGLKPLAGNAAYGTSKAAVCFLTQVASLEGASIGVRVNSISPGAIATPMWAGMDWWPELVARAGGEAAALDALVREQGYGHPNEIAAGVLFLVSDQARLITGVDLPVDGGFSVG